MGKNRHTSKKYNSKLSRAGDYLLQSYERSICHGVSELGFIEEIMVEKYCQRMFEMFPDIHDILPELATNNDGPWYIQIKSDIDGVSSNYMGTKY